MGSLPTPEREAFWRGLIAHYSRRVRGYARRAHCHEVADDIRWDVWQMATERETELMGAPDCWPILHDLVKAVLHDRKRAALYERELDAEATKTEAPQPEAAEEGRAMTSLNGRSGRSMSLRRSNGSRSIIGSAGIGHIESSPPRSTRANPQLGCMSCEA